MILKRKWTVLIFALQIPMGLYTKVYSGPFESWVNDSLGGVIYVVFWSLLGFLLAPKVKVWKTCLVVLLITSFLETLQLWHPPFLETIRRTFVGQALLGSCFTWLDFFHYIIGFCLSLLLIIYLKKIETKSSSSE